jgi:ribosome biogenesis GTPase A
VSLLLALQGFLLVLVHNVTQCDMTCSIFSVLMLIVKEILSLCPYEKLLSLYKVPSFSSVDDFLQKVATLRGKLKKGGIVDIEAAARIVLHDWNEGRISHSCFKLAN